MMGLPDNGPAGCPPSPGRPRDPNDYPKAPAEAGDAPGVAQPGPGDAGPVRRLDDQGAGSGQGQRQAGRESPAAEPVGPGPAVQLPVGLQAAGQEVEEDLPVRPRQDVAGQPGAR